MALAPADSARRFFHDFATAIQQCSNFIVALAPADSARRFFHDFATAIQQCSNFFVALAPADSARRFFHDFATAIQQSGAWSHAPWPVGLRCKLALAPTAWPPCRGSLRSDPEATVVSLDGRSAYDCVSRAAFLCKLEEVAPALLPFV